MKTDVNVFTHELSFTRKLYWVWNISWRILFSQGFKMCDIEWNRDRG